MPRNIVSATLQGGLFTSVVGKRLLFFQELGSTMDEAARQAEAAAEEGTVVVAERQSAGRGRFGRDWASPAGNIHMSVLLRPDIGTLPMVSILAGVATARTIRSTTGLSPSIKWPNDVLVRGKKVAGILVESVVLGQTVSYAVLGIGINVGLDPSGIKAIANSATSINTAADREVPPEDVLRHLLQELDSLYLQAGQPETIVREWRSLLGTLGQRVSVRWREERYHGLAETVDDLGNLKLRLDDGRLVTLTAGDVTLDTN